MVNATETLDRLVRDSRIAARSLALSLFENIDSILGRRETWDLESDSLSEHAHFRQQIEKRREALRPSQLRSAGDAWKAIKLMDKLRARFLPLPFLDDGPCSIRHHAPDLFPGEAWFFINGIATDKELLKLNGKYISKLFQRPIELIYNPTQGPFLDLLECMTGRTFDFISGPGAYALERISAALSDPEKSRVILMGHSQGGIILSNVVAALIERYSGEKKRMAKLEVYSFASACDHMPVDPELDTPERRVPYIEHFANTGDLVANLGVLEERLPINGKVYISEKQGHFLNAHYLPGIEAKQYAWHGARGKRHHDARLFEYLNGGTPEVLPIQSTPSPERAGGEPAKAPPEQARKGGRKRRVTAA